MNESRPPYVDADLYETFDDDLDEAMTRAYQRGFDVATARATSRVRLGLPIEDTST